MESHEVRPIQFTKDILLGESKPTHSISFENKVINIKKAEENEICEEKYFKSDQEKFIETSFSEKNTIIDINPKQISLKENLILSDLDKYYKFGIFPYIIFLHILIVTLITIIVIHINFIVILRFSIKLLSSSSFFFFFFLNIEICFSISYAASPNIMSLLRSDLFFACIIFDFW